jgi:hypothetical protein
MHQYAVSQVMKTIRAAVMMAKVAMAMVIILKSAVAPPHQVRIQ